MAIFDYEMWKIFVKENVFLVFLAF